MKLINVLMLDMDGVVVDFDHQFKQIIGVSPENSNRDDHYKNFSLFVNGQGFVKARECDNAKKLFNTLVRLSNEYDFDLKWLTSDGSIREFRSQVMEQKIQWLQDHGMWLGESKFILSNGWRGKADYAKSGVLLVDDTIRNCNAFENAGGDAYQYNPKNQFEFCTALEHALREHADASV